MSGIRANRMLSELRDEGICTFVGSEVRVMNQTQMFCVAHFSAHYLYLPRKVEQEPTALLDPEPILGPG